jgi:hypothetical protein
VLRQQRLGLLQQLRPGEHVEEVHRLKALCLPPRCEIDVAEIEKRHYDLSRLASGLVGWMCGNNILPIPASLPPYLSKPYRQVLPALAVK